VAHPSVDSSVFEISQLASWPWWVDVGSASMSRTSDQLRNISAGRWLATTSVLGVVGILALAIGIPDAGASQAAVDLGTAAPFAVLAGTTVTNTGASVISGDVGVSTGSAITGFPPAIVIGGSLHANDAVAIQAKSDLTTAYTTTAGLPSTQTISADLGGTELVSGVYKAPSSMGLTGTVTLNGQGDADSVFIFQAGSTLTANVGSTVALVNGAQACNVFWQVGSSATIYSSTTFAGTVMASVSITLGTGASVAGRVLAGSGAVTLNDNLITVPTCADTTPTTTVTPVTTVGSSPTTPTTTATGAPTAASGTTPAPPTVTGITPTTGPASGGTTVTITGTGFVPGGTTVTIGPGAATGVSCPSATSCTATTPPGSPGQVGVTATTAGLTSSTVGTPSFTYVAAVTTSEVIPTGAPQTGAGGAAGSDGPLLIGMGAAVLLAAVLASTQAFRRRDLPDARD
jgi:hypothetical protein